MANIDETTIITIIIQCQDFLGEKIVAGERCGGKMWLEEIPAPPTHLCTLDSLTTRLMCFDEMNIDHYCR